MWKEEGRDGRELIEGRGEHPEDSGYTKQSTSLSYEKQTN